MAFIWQAFDILGDWQTISDFKRHDFHGISLISVFGEAAIYNKYHNPYIEITNQRNTALLKVMICNRNSNYEAGFWSNDL